MRSHCSASNGSGLHRVSYMISVRIYQIEKIPVWKSFTGLVEGGGFMTLGGVGASVGVVIVVGVDAVAEADAKITHVLYDGESISAVYRQKELFRRRDHNMLGSRYGIFKCGVQDSGKVDMSSQG